MYIIQATLVVESRSPPNPLRKKNSYPPHCNDSDLLAATQTQSPAEVRHNTWSCIKRGRCCCSSSFRRAYLRDKQKLQFILRQALISSIRCAYLISTSSLPLSLQRHHGIIHLAQLVILLMISFDSAKRNDHQKNWKKRKREPSCNGFGWNFRIVFP